MGDFYIDGKVIGSVKDTEFDFKPLDHLIGPYPYDKTKRIFDKTIFDKLNKTYTSVYSYPPLPEPRIVSAESLDIHLPGLTKIGIGGKCAGEEGLHKCDEAFGFRQLAHAHICDRDPNKGMICTREEWLKNVDGTYSDILLHELAHILTDYSEFIATCGTGFLTHGIMRDGNFQLLDGHGDRWKEWATKLGVAPTPFGYPPLDKKVSW